MGRNPKNPLNPDERYPNGHFKPGVSGNPRGPKKGFDPRRFVRSYLGGESELAMVNLETGKSGKTTHTVKKVKGLLIELMIRELVLHARQSGDSDKLLKVLQYATPSMDEERVKGKAYEELMLYIVPLIQRYVPADRLADFSSDLDELVEKLIEDE